MSAFKLAVSLGVDGIELDVQLSADGRAVVMHDLRVDRTTNSRGQVSRFTAEDFRRMDAGSWFKRRLRTRPRLRSEIDSCSAAYKLPNTGASAEHVPVLEDVLDLARRANLKRLFIELKGWPKTTRPLLPMVINLIRDFRMEEQARVISFDHDLIEQAGSLDDRIRTGALFSLAHPATIGVRSVIRALEQSRAKEAALPFGLATPRMIDALHRREIPILVWTVNSKLIMRRLAAAGVDAIITNFPNRLTQVLEAGGGKIPIRERLRAGRLRKRARSGR